MSGLYDSSVLRAVRNGMVIQGYERALAEMERKLKIDEASRNAAPIVQAIRGLAQKSDRQGRALIGLTVLLVALTAWLVALTWLLLARA